MNATISVIIPIYNVEKYLDECVQSVLRQTYKDIELVLVNDGSPDGCAEICQRYADADSRVKYIYKQNGGPSDTRNVGVRESTGGRVFFLDGDDVLAQPTYLEKMDVAMKTHHAQAAVSGMANFTDGQPLQENTDKGAAIVYTASEAISAMCYGQPFEHAVGGKLYERHCLEGIDFPVGEYYEDLATSYRFFDRCTAVVYVPEVCYAYRQRGGSTMRRPVPPDIIPIAQEMAVYLSEHRPECAKAAKFSIAKEASGVLAQSWATLTSDQRKSILHIVRQGVWYALCDPKTPRSMKLKLPLVSLCPQLAAYISRSGMAQSSALYQKAKKS